MSDDRPDNLTEQERFLLQLLARTLQLQHSTSERPTKPVWLQVLESNVAVALVTVVLGGIIGQLIVTSVQEKNKQDEQLLLEYKQDLDRQQDIVERAYGLVGQCISASQHLVELTYPINQVASVKKISQPQVMERRNSVAKRHTTLTEDWQIEGNKIGWLINYRFYNCPNLLPAWRKTQQSVDSLMTCSSNTYRKNFENPMATNDTNPCEPRIDEVESNLESFAQEVDLSRHGGCSETGHKRSLMPGSSFILQKYPR